MASCLLTVNAGSSSLKLALFDLQQSDLRLLSVDVNRIGAAESKATFVDARGATLVEDHRDIPDHSSALSAAVEWIRLSHGEPIDAITHRIVHGSAGHPQPSVITRALVADLRQFVPIDPDHMPQALALIEDISRVYPNARQFACFDSAFHRSMPRVAQMYALPRAMFESGVVRYGFHGLSCEYVMERLKAVAPEAANGRVIVAHLGNGASLTAIARGASVDTTMGFSPTGGLAMGTRSGDLDPAVLLHVLNTQQTTPDAVRDLVNRRAGLLGLSGISADMGDLLAQEAIDARAAEAIAVFCHIARKFLGGLVAVLGGLDILVFTGGIGEHAAPIRERICADLECFGIELDPERNARHAPIVSRQGSRVTVYALHTDEEWMMAEHARRLLSSAGGDDV